jgi:site-specific recombinase XerD
MTPLAPYIAAFLRERLPVDRRASEHTCDTYAHAYRLLFQYAAARLSTTPSQLHLEQIDASMVLAFLQHIETERKNGAVTRNARLAAIKSFMHYIEYQVPSALEQARQILAIPIKKTDTKLVAYVTLEEMQAILNVPDPHTRFGIRDRAMLDVCFVGGLRVSELVGLKVDDVTFAPPPSVRVIGKGRRERMLPVWKRTAANLRAWLAIRGEAAVPELFLNAHGGAMTRMGFEYVLKRHVSAAKLSCPSLSPKHVSPHTLRHGCAMWLLQKTHDVRKVSLWLGHSNLQTTEKYLRVDPTEKLEAVSAFTPPSLRRGTFSAPDQLVAMLTTGTGAKGAKDYAKQATTQVPWLGPRRRLTVHNQELS